MTDDRPNILVIMTDQHSKHVTGCYGNQVVQTPNIDRIAAHGLTFDDAYCPAPVCVPSRMSFLTGRLPSRNRVMDNAHMLSSSIPTFAHALGAAGYETALMGKMHFVGVDHRHGFEKRPLGEFLGRYPGVPELGGPRWTKFPAGTSGQARVSVETAGTGTTTYQWFDREVTNTAVRYLKAAGERRERFGKPFCAVVGLNLPHCPFVTPKELFEYYASVVPDPLEDENPPATVRRHQARRGLLEPPVSKHQIRLVRAAYYALVTYVDSLIGEITDALDRYDLADDTVVIYCADHGEMAGDHGCFWKSIYYEGAASVPLIICVPKSERTGSRSSAIVNLYDLAPTICDFAGTGLPYIDGTSLLSPLDKKRGTEPTDDTKLTTTFSELYDPKGGSPVLSRMVRSGRYKLWQFFDDENLSSTLYDLEADPHELTDLSSSHQHRATRETLESLLTENWDPDAVRRMCEEETEATAIFSAYGAEVRPPVEEALTIPPPWLEEDVEIL